MNSLAKGFTLIELLIVVAIIGILAAIAVPNFLNAQTRAAVARVVADFKAIQTAMNMYYMDQNDYPPDPIGVGPNIEDRSYKALTTPVAYLSSVEVFRDYFTNKTGRADDFTFTRNFYDYGHRPYIREAGVGYAVVSFGPDRIPTMPWGAETMALMQKGNIGNLVFLYSPTNGLISTGDIVMNSNQIYIP